MVRFRKNLGLRKYPSGRYKYKIMSSRLLFRNRRIKKMMQRRRRKPEIKWADISGEQSTVSAISYFSCHPASIQQGPGRNQRIGNVIKSLRVTVDMVFYSISVTDGAPVPNGQTVRVICASPRIDLAQFHAHLLSLTFNSFAVDTNLAKIYFDTRFRLGNPFLNHTNTYKYIKKIIKFPRRVQFVSDADNVIRDSRDHLWVYIYPEGESPMTVNWQHRVKYTFIDI